jgi:ribosomal protein L24
MRRARRGTATTDSTKGDTMKRLCIALALAVLLLLTAGIGTAAAESGEPVASTELAGPAMGPAQQETMDASAPAPAPDAGSLDQSNDAASNGTAGNANAAKQDADQDQGSPGTQVIGQSAKNDQDALALALTLQKGASNTNAPVNVLSKGDSGDVNQENTATSDATAGNLNLTEQDADQEQSGDDCKCKDDGGSQLIGQSADNEQQAAALAKTVQEKPSNTNVSIRVLSPGDAGNVTQTNTASSNATAGNVNLTKQDADQEQGGGHGRDCKCAGDGPQVIGQSADSDQKAAAAAATVQEKPSNKNISIRVLSSGDDGDVTQTNTATSNATAGNLNALSQDADQEQGGRDCKCGDGTQLIGQSAKSEQDATAAAATFQVKPSNTNTSIRVLSKGDDGDVTQTNTATSNATAGNLNLTKQDADQEQSGGSGIQVIGQAAKNDQDATALAATFQLGASNVNAPIRVLSKGDSGSVTQSNTASSDANAANVNWLSQDADQSQGGKGRHDDKGYDNQGSYDEHDCCGTGIQAIGQLAKNDQDATAAALTVQAGTDRPCSCTHEPSFGNSNMPVRVGSKGDDGSVSQSNTATSDADAFNLNATKQDADQKQSGHGCRCWEAFGIQAIGQLAESDQDAFAAAATFQIGATNTSAPVRTGGYGHDKRRNHGPARD